MSKAAIKVCSLAGDTGFGFSMSSLKRALDLGAGVIAAQGTSADPDLIIWAQARLFIPWWAFVAIWRPCCPIRGLHASRW